MEKFAVADTLSTEETEDVEPDVESVTGTDALDELARLPVLLTRLVPDSVGIVVWGKASLPLPEVDWSVLEEEDTPVAVLLVSEAVLLVPKM